MALAKQDEGTKKKTNTQTVTVGGRTVNVPATNTPTVNKPQNTATVGGRVINTPSVQPSTQRSAGNAPTINKTYTTADRKAVSDSGKHQAISAPGVFGNIATAGQNNVDYYNNMKQQRFESKRQSDKNEAQTLLQDRKSALDNKIKENPDYALNLYQFRGANGEVLSGQDYKNRTSEYENGVLNLNNSYLALQDQYKRDGDVNRFNQGVDELTKKYSELENERNALNSLTVEYNSTAQSEYDANKERMKAIIQETSALKKNGGDMAVLNALNNEYVQLQNRNEELKGIVDDITAVQDNDKYQYLLNSNNQKELTEFESYLASQNDGVVGWATRGLAKWSATGISGLLSLGDITADLLGEEAGNAIYSVAESLKESGTISDESFEKISAVANELKEFDYLNDNTYSNQLREFRDRMDREMYSNPNMSVTTEVMAKMIDSSLENQVRYNMLGEVGTYAMALSTLGDSYYEMRTNGYSKGVSIGGSLLKAYITKKSEELSTERYFKILGSTAGSKIDKAFFSILFNNVISSVPEEGLEEGAEYIGDYLVDVIANALEPGKATPEFKAGDLFNNALMAMGSAFFTSAGGSVQGTIAYMNAVPQINSVSEYHQFSAELERLKAIASTEVDLEVKNNLEQFIRSAEFRKAQFEEKSATANAVTLEEDFAHLESQEQADETYKESMVPDATNMANEQAKIDNEVSEASQAIKDITENYLASRNILMNADEYVSLSEESRRNVSEVQNYATKLKVKVGFSNSVDGDGFYDPKTNTIMLNPNSKMGELSTLVHEITHGTESSGKFYDTLANLVKDSFDGNYDNALKNIKSFYKKQGIALDDPGAKREFTAINTQHMLGNKEFVEKLIRYDNSLAYRIYRNVLSMTSSDVKTEVENAFMQAFRANNTINTGSLAFSKGFTPSDLKEDVDNKGRKLSKGQEKFFGGSKLVNENGNLLRLYHTSEAFFNTFDPRGTDHYRFGNKVVNYFSTDETVSGSYAGDEYRQITGEDSYNEYEADVLREQVLRDLIKEKDQEYRDSYGALENQMREAVRNEKVQKAVDAIERNIKNTDIFSVNSDPILFGLGSGYNQSLLSSIEYDISSVKNQGGNAPYNKISSLLQLYELRNGGKYFDAKPASEVRELLAPIDDVSVQPLIELQEKYKTETIRLLDELDELRGKRENIEQETSKGKQYVGYGKATNPYILENNSGERVDWNNINALDYRMPNEDFALIENEILRASRSLGTEDFEKLINKPGVNKWILNSISDEARDALAKNPVMLANFASSLRDIFTYVDRNLKHPDLEFLKQEYPEAYKEEVRSIIDGVEKLVKNKLKTGREFNSQGTKYSDLNTLETNDVVGAILSLNEFAGTSYDGVVFKDITDSASYKAQGISSDIIALFEPNQFKLLENENPTEETDIRWSKGMALNDLREEAYYDTGNIDVDTLMNDIVDSMSEEELRRFLDEGEFTYATPEEVEDDPEVQEEGLWVKEPEGDYIKIDDDYVSNGKTVAWKDERIDAMIEENEKGNFAFSGHDPYQYHYAIKLSPKEYEALSYLFDPRHNEVWRDEVATQPENYGNGEVTPEKLGGWARNYDDSNDPRRYRYKRKIDYMFFDAEYENGVLKIKEQEGNHRALILENSGYESMPVLLGTDTKLRGPIQLAGMNAGDIKNPNVKLFSSGEYVELISKNRDELIRRFGSGTNADIQYSKGMTAKMLSQNAEYEKAVAKGDIEKVKKLVDQVAKENGYSTKVFHGTPYGGFTVFDRNGEGFSWFTEDSGYASIYANGEIDSSEIFEGYLRDGKYLDVGNIEGDITTEGGEWSTNSKNTDDWEYKLKGEFTNEFKKLASLVGMSPDELWNELIKDPYFDKSGGAIYSATRTKAFADIVRDMGYDGIEATEGKNGVKTYGVLDSSSFKRTGRYRGEAGLFDEKQTIDDVVERDDYGNVIPLSERFKQESDDMRYSKGMKPQDLLADTEEYRATIAPYYDTRLNENNRDELIKMAEEAYDNVAKEIADYLGIKLTPKAENIGGFENDEGKRLRELSWTYDLKGVDSETARLFTSLMGDLAFENQEAVICMRYLSEDEGQHIAGEEGPDGGTYGKEYGFKYKDLKTVEETLKKADIANYNIDRKTNYLTVQDFGFDDDLPEKLDILLEGNNYETKEERPIYSYYLSREARQSLYEAWGITEGGLQEGNQGGISGRISEANKRVTDVIEKKKSGTESPFLRRPEVKAYQQDSDGDLNLTDEDLKNYRVIDSATTEKYGKKNIDKETGILKPKAIIELDSTIGKTTHEEEIQDGEEYAGKFVEALDNGADVDDLLQRLMDHPLENGLVRAYYVSQALADRGMESEYMELAQWARDIDNLGGKLIESTKILYNLDSTFSKAVYLTQVEENLKSEYKEHLKNKKGVDVEQTISEIFNEYANKIINSKTSREFRSAIGALTREVNRRMPKTIWDRIHQYRMLAMLSGTKTAVSNFVSNTFSLGLYKMNSMNQALLESAMQNVEIKSFDDKKTYQIKQEDRNATLRKDSTATKRNRKLATEIWDSLGENEKTKYGIETEKIPDIIKNNLKIKNETTQSKLSKAVGGLFDTVQNVQGVLLNDAPFAKMAFVQRFDELARARGIDTEKINKSSKEYARLIDDAYNYAQEVVSHNDTDISKTIANLTRRSASNVRINEDSTLVGLDKQIKRFKERANNGEPIYRFIDSAVSKLQKWFVPFYKTNASLLQKSLQFSPLEWGQVINDWGKVKAGRMEVVDMVEHMSKAVTGTELYLVGAIFGFLGLLKWEKDDEDYSGRLSIKIPGTDKGYTVDFIDPISTIFAKGVVLAQNISEQGGPFKTIEGLVRDYEDIFLSDELDMFSSMKDFFDTVGKVRKGKDDYGEYTLGDGSTDIAFSVLNSYIPSIVRDVSRMIDPAKKNVYDTDNKKYLFNRLVNSTPFRTNLVDKKDATGRTINYTQPFTGNDVFDRILTQMVSRGKLVDSNGQAITTRSGSQNMQATSSDSYTQMAKDFQYKDENGDGFSDAHWIRDSVPSNIYPAGVQTELTPKEKETYGKTWTDTWTSGANYLADNDIYKGLSYENQADVVYELQGFARECIEADYCMANDLEMTEAQRTANEIRNFCTVNGKLDGKMLGLIALGTAKENKLASGGQRYVMAEQDEEGKTIRNSRQLAMRHIYEEAGIYDKIVEAVQNSNGALTYADFGLGKTVVEKYSDEKAGSDYQTIYNKTMKSSSKKSSKVSGGSAGGITKAKGGGSTKKLSMAPNPVRETKVANSYLKAYADVFKRNSSKATSSSGGTVICPKCGNRVSSGLSRCPICGTSL